MHYDTRLAAIDGHGRFVLAICHGEHKIGGEETRETRYARLVTGDAGDAHVLRELTELFLLPRPACPAAARRACEMARTQAELARSQAGRGSMAAHYQTNAQQALHSAALAERDGVRVPRVFHASRTGMALVGFEPSLRAISGEALPGHLRLVDLVAGRIAGDWSSAREPLDPPGKGVARFSSVELARARALSTDGRTALLPAARLATPGLTACALADGLPDMAHLQIAATAVAAIEGGWIVASQTSLAWLDEDLRPRKEVPLPRGTACWSLRATADGALVALPGAGGGEVWLLARDGGKPRRFAPHRGAARDAHASVALSDDGQWLATRCKGEVALTRLADGVSWTIGACADRIHEDPASDGHVVRSLVPAAIALVGHRLLLAQHDGVRAAALEAEGPGAFVSEQGRPGARKPIRVTAGMDLPSMLRAARLEDLGAAIGHLHSPALRMRSKALRKAGWQMPGKSGAPPLGASRLGGWPDLPPALEWPTWQSRPMAFLAQLDLAQAQAVEPRLRLPATGVLSFFLACTHETYQKDGDPRPRYLVDVMAGTESGSAEAWRVLYHPDASGLERRAYPFAPYPELFQPCAITYSRGGLALPDEQTAAYSLLTEAMTQSQRDDYNELLGLLKSDDAHPVEQLMGYPQLLQCTPPELMCELSARGADPWQHPEPASQAYKELARTSCEWTLLLQLTSHADADFCWGDAGHLYFYGDREAMARGDFSRVWVNFEN